jgi:hypothetical protein
VPIVTEVGQVPNEASEVWPTEELEHAAIRTTKSERMPNRIASLAPG